MNRLHLVKLKRVCAFALFALLLGAAGTTNAIAQTTFESGDLAYSLNGDGRTVTVTGFRNGFTVPTKYSLTIPNSVAYDNATYYVTAIGDNAFADYDDVMALYLPYPSDPNNNNRYFPVTIGVSAFEGCDDLYDLYNCEAVVTIGARAFKDTPINYFRFSISTLESIGASAFEGCTHLSGFDLIKNNNNVDYSNDYRHSTLTTIGASAFKGCELLNGKLYLPASVTSVGANAFEDCEGITKVFIFGAPAIGASAFAGCNLTDVYCFNAQQMVTQADAFDATTTASANLYVPQALLSSYLSGWSAFRPRISSLESTPIEVDYNNLKYRLNYSNHTATIAGLADAYTGYVYDQYISIYAGQTFFGENFAITAIADEAFKNTSVRQVAFYNYYLNWVGTTNPSNENNIQTIGESAFEGCTNLHSIINFYYLSQLQTIGNSAFEGCTNLTTIQFVWIDYENVYSLPNFTTIGAQAFKNCGLTGTLEIPASVTSIGEEAFYGCSGLNGQIILNGTAANMLGSSAFEGCSNITEVVSLSTTPPGHVDGATNAFTGLFNKTLYVPESAIGAYQTHDYWKEFYYTNHLQSLESLYGEGNIAQNGFIFSLDETAGEATVLGHTLGAEGYTSTNLSIPGYLVYNGHNYPVTAIANNAFKNYTSPTYISLPRPSDHFASKEDSYNYLSINIGDYAFYGCKNARFNSSSWVKSFGDYAFYGCEKLEHVSCGLAETVGDYAFYGCTGLRDVYMSGFQIRSIGAHAFDGCTSLCVLEFGENMSQYVKPQALVIGDYAFHGCTNIGNSNTYTITASVSPEGAGYITQGPGSYRFGSQCSLSVGTYNGYRFVNWTKDGEVVSTNSYYYFPVTGDATFVANFTADRDVTTSSISPIGEDANVSDGSTNMDKSNGKEDTPPTTMLNLMGSRVASIGAHAFEGCEYITQVILYDGLVSIGDYAFNGCTSLSSVVDKASDHNLDLSLPYLTTVGQHAFDGCAFSGNLTLGNNVTSVGASAFAGMTFANGRLTIGQRLGSIGASAFEDATFGQILSYAEDAPTLGTDALKSFTKSNPVRVPKCSVDDYQSNWTGFTNISTNGYEKDSRGFYFTISGGNATITGMESSASKTNSNKLVIPETITAYDCTTGNITGEYTVTAIGYKAFYGCTDYNGGLEIPSTVTRIDPYAFAYSSFTGPLNLPEHLTSLGGAAFAYCSGFTGGLTLPEGLTTVPDGAFMFDKGLNGKLTIPSTVTSIGQMAFGGCGFTGDFFMPNSVTSCGMLAFTLNPFDGELVLSNNLSEQDFQGYGGVYPYSVVGCQFKKVTLGRTTMAVLTYALAPIADFWNFVIGSPTIEKLVSLAPTPPMFIEFGGIFKGGQELPEFLKGISEVRDSDPDPLTTEEIALGYLGIDPNTPVYVPCSSFTYYKQFTSAQLGYDNLWSDLNIIGIPEFTTAGNWSVSGNWSSCGTPANDLTGHAIIAANCTLDQNVTIGDLYINQNCTVTIPSGFTLTAKHIFTDEGGSGEGLVIVEDGGQLIHDIENVNASVERDITGYSQSGSWNFIASPTVADYTPTTSNGILASNDDNYDLYYYDEAAHYWRNYKPSANSLDPNFKFNNGQGYLYANSDNTTLRFNGTVSPSNEQKTFDLSYSATIDEDANVLAGWNLVGNPFTCNATINKSFYKINNGAINTVACTSSTPIEPCEGVMVVAENTDENVTFTRVTPQQGSGSNNAKGSLNVRVARKALLRGEAAEIAQDNAIVSFDENDRLPKFVFNADAAKIYIPQNGKEYAIAVSEMRGELPLNFKAAENGSYTITVIPEGMELSYLHLIDNITGDDTDLLATPSYSFEAKMSDYESRFRLVFACSNDENADSDSATFAFFNGSEWVIANPSTGSGQAILQVVDVMGRVLHSESVIGNASLNMNVPSGVYVLRLVNGENVKTQKIVVR